MITNEGTSIFPPMPDYQSWILGIFYGSRVIYVWSKVLCYGASQGVLWEGRGVHLISPCHENICDKNYLGIIVYQARYQVWPTGFEFDAYGKDSTTCSKSNSTHKAQLCSQSNPTNKGKQ